MKKVLAGLGRCDLIRNACREERVPRMDGKIQLEA
jgi:hypothetical protein